jgi:hypothetical protein
VNRRKRRAKSDKLDADKLEKQRKQRRKQRDRENKGTEKTKGQRKQRDSLCIFLALNGLRKNPSAPAPGFAGSLVPNYRNTHSRNGIDSIRIVEQKCTTWKAH